jgi:hypothetical protein
MQSGSLKYGRNTLKNLSYKLAIMSRTIFICTDMHSEDVKVYGSIKAMLDNVKEGIPSGSTLYKHDWSEPFENGYVTIKKTKLITTTFKRKKHVNVRRKTKFSKTH